MNYKKLSFIVILICLFFLVGCSKIANAENEGDKYFYNTASGKIYTDLSDNFDLKVEKWEIHYDEESKQDRILFSIAIKNKTTDVMRNFFAVILFYEEASSIIASGIMRYDIFEPCDLIPQTTANGASYAFDALVEADEWLEESKVDKEAMFELLRNITLDLKWDGGAETIQLTCDKLYQAEEN